MNKEEIAIEQALTWVKDIAKPKTWRTYLSAMKLALALNFFGQKSS